MHEPHKAAALWLTTSVALIFLFIVDPVRSDAYPVCVFHALTGWYCPGCGSARALHQLLHGHLPEALGLNAAAVLLVPAFACSALSYTSRVVFRNPFRRGLVPASRIHLLLAFIVAFWIVRNIPAHPFSLLAP
jgi:hypothetical protein